MAKSYTLTDIGGIGPASAKKLAAAGTATIAELAACDPAQLQQLDGMPSSADFTAWVEQAKQLLASGEGEGEAEGPQVVAAPSPQAGVGAEAAKPAPGQAAADKATAAAKAQAKPPVEKVVRRRFAVAWDLLHDMELHKPGGNGVALTEAQFEQLKPTGVVSGSWKDGSKADA